MLYVFPAFYSHADGLSAREQVDMDDFDRRLAESGVSFDFDDSAAEASDVDQNAWHTHDRGVDS